MPTKFNDCSKHPNSDANSTKQDTNSKGIKPLKYIMSVEAQPISKQATDLSTPLLQSENASKLKPNDKQLISASSTDQPTTLAQSDDKSCCWDVAKFLLDETTSMFSNFFRGDKVQRKKNKLKAFFSDDIEKRTFVEKKCIYNAYERIIFPKLEAPTKQDNDLQTLSQINQKLREFVNNNPEQLRPHLKQVMETTRTLYHWATNFQECFDLDEEWVQTGMKKQEITKDIFKASLEKLMKPLENLTFIQKILGSRPISDLVRECDSSKIVQHFEDLTRANAALRCIHFLLKDGIPVGYPPRQINGLKRVETSSFGNNCLIHALLKVGQPHLESTKIEQMAIDIRNGLSIKMEQKREEYNKHQKKVEDDGILLNTFSQRYHAVRNGSMLDLGSYDGKELINWLHDMGFIEPNRSVLVYKLRHGKIQCIEQVSPALKEKQKPYSLFLYDDYHFEAMVEPQYHKSAF